jgi:hypothetical protein
MHLTDRFQVGKQQSASSCLSLEDYGEWKREVTVWTKKWAKREKNDTDVKMISYLFR